MKNIARKKGVLFSSIAGLIEKFIYHKNLFSNISWLSIDQFIRLGLNVFIGIKIAKHFGPEFFGFWNYATASVALFYIAASLGFDGIVIRELVSGVYRQSAIVATAFALRVFSGVLSFLACIFLYYFTESNEFQYFLILITSFGLLIQAFEVPAIYFQARVESKIIVICKGAAFFAGFFVKVFLLLNSYSLTYFVWIAQVELLIGALFLSLTYLKRNKDFRFNFNSSLARLLIRDGWPLILSGILVTIHMRIDQVMLGKLSTIESVGNYSVAIKIAEISYVLPVFVVNTLTPLILAMKTDLMLLKSKLQQIYDFFTWGGIIFATIVCLNADFIIEILYGNQFEEAGAILAIYVWTAVAVFLGTGSGMYFLAINKTKIGLIRLIFGVGLNIPLNFLLIPSLQGQGAAIATLISYFLALYAVDFFFARDNFYLLMRSFNLFRLLKMKERAKMTG